MGFESLLLIVVVVEAVWILSSLFRGSEEERRPPGGRPAPRPGAAPNRPRPAATNVDRFLEEINRRRREAAERQGAVPQRPTAPAASARPPSRQGTPPAPVRTSPPTPSRFPPVEVVVARPQPGAVEAGAVVEERKVPAVQPLAPRPTGSYVTETFVPSAVTEVRMARAITSSAQLAASRVSPVLAELMPLLRDRKSLRTAFLLKEIFGRPLCQRGLNAQREIR